MLTDILLALPTRGSIVLIIVFSLLLLNSGTLYLNLSFLTSTTYLRLKGRSIITCGGVKLFYVKKFLSCNSFNIFNTFLLSFISFYFLFISLFIILQPRLDEGIRSRLGANYYKKKKKKRKVRNPM